MAQKKTMPVTAIGMAAMLSVTMGAAPAFADEEPTVPDNPDPKHQEGTANSQAPTTMEEAEQELHDAQALVEQTGADLSLAETGLAQAHANNDAAAKEANDAAAAASSAASGVEDAFQEAKANATEELANAEGALSDGNAAVNVATNAQVEAQNAENAAIAEKDSAKAALDVAMALAPNMAPALENLENAQANAEAASGELDSANADREAVAALQEKAAAEKDAAQKAYVDATANAAKAADDKAAAAEAYEWAKMAYEDFMRANGEVDVIVLRANLDQAKAAYDAAAAENDAATIALASAAENLAKAEEEFAAAEKALADANATVSATDPSALKDAKDIADAAKTAADAVLADAQAAIQPVTADYSARAADKDVAEAAKTQAEADFANAQAVVDNAENALAAAIAENKPASGCDKNGVSYSYTIIDFFKAVGSTDAAELFETAKYKDDTHPGESWDATASNKVFTSLEFIKECNDLRKADPLCTKNEELLVTDRLMAMAILNANRSAEVWGHCLQFSVAENLAQGYRDPYDGWYTYEKGLYDSGNTSQAGHYRNIIKNTYKYTGFGFGSSWTASQVFASSIKAGEQAYTVDQWYERYNAWYQSLPKAESTNVVNARVALAEAQANLEQKQDALTAAVTAAEEAAAAYVPAETAYNEAAAALGAAQAAAEEAAANAIAATQAYMNADTAHARALATQEVAQENAVKTASALETAQGTFAAAQTRATDAATDLAGKIDAYQAAKAAYDTVPSAFEQVREALDAAIANRDSAIAAENAALETLSGAEIRYANAVDGFDAAEKNLSAANLAVNTATEALDAAYAKLADAQKDYDQVIADNQAVADAQAAYNVAVAAVEVAEGNLAEANRVLAEAQEAVKELEKIRDAANDKKQRADQLSVVSALEIPIEDADFAYLNEIIHDMKGIQQAAEEAAGRLDGAKAAVADAQQQRDEANDAYMDALARLAIAQVTYDDFKQARDAEVADSTNNMGAVVAGAGIGSGPSAGVISLAPTANVASEGEAVQIEKAVPAGDKAMTDGAFWTNLAGMASAQRETIVDEASPLAPGATVAAPEANDVDVAPIATGIGGAIAAIAAIFAALGFRRRKEER